MPCKPSTTAYTSRGEVVNKLRFANEKPRKKLMYRDLLPQIRHEKLLSAWKETRIARARDQGQEVQDLNELTSSKDVLSREAPIINLLSEAEDDLPGVSETPDGRDMDRMHLQTACSSPGAMASASQLFVDQTLNPFSLTPSQHSSNADFEPPPHSKPPVVASHSRDRITESPQTLQEDILVQVNGLEDILGAGDVAMGTIEVPQSPSKLTVLDHRLLPMSYAKKLPPKSGIHQQASTQRTFRRILSEGDSHIHRQNGIDPEEGLQITAKATTTGVRQSPEKLQKPFRSPTKMQRSVSDTTYIAQRGNLQPREEFIPAAVEAGFDPWSGPEAYILFDWWPPGKTKPAFALNE